MTAEDRESSDVAAFKEKGNDYFRKKQYSDAIACYSNALELVYREDCVAVQESDKLKIDLRNNRAAAALQSLDFEMALKDCNEILEKLGCQDNIKARYRRAQALYGLQKYSNALNDLRFLLQHDPKNASAVTLARKITIQVQRQQDPKYLYEEALRELIETTDIWFKSERWMKVDSTEKALFKYKTYCHLDAEETAKTCAFVNDTNDVGMQTLWSIVGKILAHAMAQNLNADHDKATVSAIQRLIQMCLHLLSQAANASPTGTHKVIKSSLSHDQAKETKSTLEQLSSFFTQIVQSEYEHSMSDTHESELLSNIAKKHYIKLCGNVSKGILYALYEPNATIPPILLNIDKNLLQKLNRLAFSSVLNGLRSKSIELELCALNVLLSSFLVPTKPESKSDKTAAPTQLQAEFVSLAQSEDLLSLFHSCAVAALSVSQKDWSLDHNDSITEDKCIDRYNHCSLLSRISMALTQLLSSLSSDKSIDLQQLVHIQCIQPVLSASVTSKEDVERATASCLFLSSLFLCNSKLAIQATNMRFVECIHSLLTASKSFVANAIAADSNTCRAWQEIFVECIASIAGAENGISYLSPELRSEIHKMLLARMDNADLILRASALSIHIKILMIEKRLDDAQDTDPYSNIIFQVLVAAHQNEIKLQAIMAKNKDLESFGKMLHYTAVSPKERAIEALSYVITLVRVKEAFSRHMKAIESVFDLRSHQISDSKYKETNVRYNIFYGAAYVLFHTLTSESALKKKKMENMDMTPEQYEELQRALKQKSALEDGDSEVQVKWRVEKIIESQFVLTTLIQFLKCTRSRNVMEMGVSSALHMAQVPSTRGKLCQSGVFQALLVHALSAADVEKDKAIAISATHAMAKILVTTNPNLISQTTLFSSIRPLLEACKVEDSLLQFESLLALTNIASVSLETKDRIVNTPYALSNIQYLQFSEHKLLRRAATEVLCNLIPNELVLEKVFQNEEKMRLWLAFASVEEQKEDFETSRAASGALAMVSEIPELALEMIRNGGIETFAKLVLDTEHDDSLYRALYGLKNMLKELNSRKETERIERGSIEAKVYGEKLKVFLERRIEELKGKSASANIREEAAQCLVAVMEARCT